MCKMHTFVSGLFKFPVPVQDHFFILFICALLITVNWAWQTYGASSKCHDPRAVTFIIQAVTPTLLGDPLLTVIHVLPSPAVNSNGNGAPKALALGTTRNCAETAFLCRMYWPCIL